MKLTFLGLASSVLLTAQSTRPADLLPRNVTVEEVGFKGRIATRLTDKATGDLPDGQRIAILKVVEFQDGIIEFDLAGDRVPGAAEASRGFTGFAFRVSPDGKSYNAFYLRPYDGRLKDQVQRNYSAQYISIPEVGWRKLREAYADLVPGEWTKVIDLWIDPSSLSHFSNVRIAK